MRKYNFAAPKTYRDMFVPGKLLELAEEVYSDKSRREYTGLTLDELAKIHTLYSVLDPREMSILDLEDETVYKTVNDKEVFGSDIKAITMLMYDRPRSAYVEFGKVKQCHESMYSGGVPLPMLGFKRFRNVKYDSWRQQFGRAAHIDSESFELMDGLGALEKAFKIDILLGNTLASTKYNNITDSIEWKDKGMGLLLLSTLRGINYVPNANTLNYLRMKGKGNYKGSFATVYGTARVDASTDDTIDNNIIKMFNIASTPIRLLMSQRWAWYGNHRCTDMICDLQDWDDMPTKHDTVVNAFVGLKPQDKSVSGIGALFGIGEKK